MFIIATQTGLAKDTLFAEEGRCARERAESAGLASSMNFRPSLPRPHRPEIMGTRHVAAAGHYLAVQAAFQILEAGGNAVDAGVAGGLALGVVESEMVGVAGVAPILIYLAERDEVLTISGVGTWPRAASCELFQQDHGGAIPRGILRTVVPAAPDAWITALERFGSMSFGDVAAAAIELARRVPDVSADGRSHR